MSEQSQALEKPKRKPGRKPTGKPYREMISVPAPLAPAIREIVKAYREQEREAAKP